MSDKDKNTKEKDTNTKDNNEGTFIKLSCLFK